MPYIVPSSAETLADQLLYTHGMLVDVTCRTCSADVQVKKNSQHHTSIQWNTAAVATCVVFAEMDRAPQGRAVHVACPRLVETIEAAVREGHVPVGAAGPDGVSVDAADRAEVTDE